MNTDPAKKIRDIHLVPLFWLSCPKMGYPIQIPEKPNIYLLPIKTPLPEFIQGCFPVKNQWTVRLAVEKAEKRLGFRRQDMIIIEFEFSAGGDLVDKQDCDVIDVTHVYIPLIDDKMEDGLKKFMGLLDNLPSPGYPHCILMSCHNGYNKTGYAISGLFSQMMKFPIRAATLLFASKRPPGIFSQVVIDQLNQLDPSGQPAEISELPSFISPFPENINEETITDIKVINSADFCEEGGYLVTDPNTVTFLSKLLRAAVPISQSSKFRHPACGEPIPCVFVWSMNRFNDFKGEQFRVSYSPRGESVFILITEKTGFYVSYGPDQYYFIPAKITAELPIVCTAVYGMRKGKRLLIITDVLLCGKLYLELQMDLEERLKIIWHHILSKIEGSTIKVAYRPFAHLKYSTTLFRDFKKFTECDGIVCDGISLVNHRTYPVGGSLFVPVHPALNFFVVLNTPKSAILYTRSDECSNLFVPFTVYMVEANVVVAKLNRKVVKFEISKESKSNLIKFKPIAICNNGLCDLTSYARSIIVFLTEDQLVSNIMIQLRKTISQK